MDKSEEYADKALERFLAKSALLPSKLSYCEGLSHLVEFFHAEAKRAYQAGQAGADRKETKEEMKNGY